ncbi:MAG: S-layer homology domain-containing protein [Bacillota bacterium]|nr:S-layer homology domain-containing protein [Bacillota bacterium]
MKFKIFSTLFIILFILCIIPSFASVSPTGLALYGSLSLSIPESGHKTYSYKAVYLDEDGNELPIEDVNFDVTTKVPDGVTVNINDHTVTVYDSANYGESFEITLSPSNSYSYINERKYTITLSDNLILNGDFKDLPSMNEWELFESSKLSLVDGVVDFDYKAPFQSEYTLRPSNPVYLKGGQLYIFNASIKSAEGYIGNKNGENSYTVNEGSISIVIKDLNYDKWHNVSVPFRVPGDGIYDFSFIFSSDESPLPVFIDNISVIASHPMPTSIYVDAPLSFNVPKTDAISAPFEAYAKDQEGNAMTSDLSYSVSPETAFIGVENNKITILPGAPEGIYTITVKASKYPYIYTTFDISLISAGIDNGDFESKYSSESWTPSSPGVYSIVNSNKNSYAQFIPNNGMGALYNNSYVTFSAEQSYVFKADLRQKYSDAPCHITFVIQDINNPDNLVLCAYFDLTSDWQTKKAVFTPEENITGRFIIAVNTDEGFDEQEIYMDNISVELASVKVTDVKIKGTVARGRTVKGTFNFENNFDGENASVTNWLISDTVDGEYRALSYNNVDEIEITEYMEGKYLKFEVTPMSLTAGIIGTTVYSQAIKVNSPNSTTVVEVDTPDNKGSSSDNTASDGSSNTTSDKNTNTTEKANTPKIVNLSSYSGSQNIFNDLNEHWAKDDIALMKAAGIVSGYSDSNFKPDNNITRAEFCAFLIRSLGLENGKYAGIFTDVSPQSWYAGVVQTVYDMGYSKGITETSFKPNDPITREQIMVMLVRTYNLVKNQAEVQENNLSASFADINDVSNYALESVNKAFKLGIVKGNQSNYICPKGLATRAEALVMIRRLLDTLNQ